MFTLFYPIIIDVEKSATNDRNFPQFSTNWFQETAAQNFQNGCTPLLGASGFSNSLACTVPTVTCRLHRQWHCHQDQGRGATRSSGDIKILTNSFSLSFQSVSTSNVSSLICFIPNKYFPILVLEREYHTMRDSQPDHGPQGDPCGRHHGPP